MSLANPLTGAKVGARPAAARPQAKASVRKAIFTVHLWVGLALSVWFALLGLTGALLIFKPQVDAFLNPALFRSHTPAPGAAPLSPDAALTAAQAAHPETAFKRLAFPQGRQGAYVLRFGEEKKERELFVDAYTGAILGERDKHGALLEWVLELHKALLLRDLGKQVNGIGALFLVGLIATGIYLWWPANARQWPQRFQVKTNASPKRLLFDLHNVFGVYSLPVLLLIALTGAVFVYEKQVERGVYALTGAAMPAEKEKPGKKEPKPGKHGGGAPVLSLGVGLAALETASAAAAPGTYLKHVELPDKAGKPVRIHRERRSGFWANNKVRLQFDPRSGALLKVEDEQNDVLAKRILRWNGPLHEGKWGGLATQWLYLLIGLVVPLGLGITGVAKWLQTRQSRAKNRAKHQVGLDKPVAAPAPLT